MTLTNKNKIRKVRLQKGLTQQALADLVGTSQQQIQRLEVGAQSARLELASAICRALDSPLGAIFPGAEGLRSHQVEGGWATRDPKAIAKAHEAGLDIDRDFHTFKVYLRGGHEGVFPIQSDDRDRIDSVLQDPEFTGQIDFYSGDHWILLNLDHLIIAQLLWDPLTGPPIGDLGDDDDPELSVRVWLSSRPEPFIYDVEADLSDELLDDRYQLKDLVFYAGMGEDSILRFEDVDGEWVYLRREDISMISISLAALYPSLIESQE